MTSPAETAVNQLRTAAQTLLDRADDAQEDLDTEPYWACYDKTTAWYDGFANGMGGKSSELAGLLSPDAARHIAAWLRIEADIIQIRIDQGHEFWNVHAGGDAAMALARIVTTAAEEAQR